MSAAVPSGQRTRLDRFLGIEPGDGYDRRHLLTCW
jgi:hypothetical protein